ncbi:MAG TPA: DUF6169 family protein [Saprospiraceae bacterium]|nr:DUF6169 family protein [Saprospiraceae bacterium]
MYQHYPINDNSYQFLTDIGTTYVVEFYKASSYFHPNCNYCSRIEAISFYPISPHKSIFDINISETIADIIRIRCQEKNGAVLYVCDSIDKKEIGRSKLFERWYNIYGGGVYHFQSSIIEYQDNISYAGLIVPIANQDAILFLEEFNLGIQYLINKEI